MTREIKLPGPDHPITVEPTNARVTVRVGDRIIADTTDALSLREANYPVAQYVPLADVDPSVITRSSTHTYCPYKGEASYYSISGPDGELADVIWTYDQPYESVAGIAGHVAFYPNRVQLTVAE